MKLLWNVECEKVKQLLLNHFNTLVRIFPWRRFFFHAFSYLRLSTNRFREHRFVLFCYIMEQQALITNHHLLCFSGNILLLKFHRTTKSNDSKVGDLTLVFRRLSYNQEKNAFVKAAEGAVVLSGGISSRTDILMCKCAYNCQKRVDTPCILVIKKSENEENFQYRLFTLCSDRLELCLQFKLPYDMRKNVCILSGPVVMWRHAGGVFFMSLQTGAVKSVLVQVCHAVFGELPLRKGNVFVIGVQEFSNTQSVSQNQGYFIENGHTFDGNMILPHPYISITQCMLILSAEKTDCNKVLQSAVVAATSQQQLVYFENGMVKNACKLPFEQPNNVQIADAGRCGSMFVVSFQRGHACAVWKGTFQVCKNRI